jgi:flagellin-like protein
MKRIAKNVQGFSPVFTTVLMLLMVVIGMSVTFAYFTIYVSDFQVGRGSAPMELIEIEDVWFIDNQTIRVTLYNYGRVDIQINSLFIDDILAEFSNVDGYNNTLTLGVRAHEEIVVPYNVTLNTSYQFKLVTHRGTAFSGKYISPAIW